VAETPTLFHGNRHLHLRRLHHPLPSTMNEMVEKMVIIAGNDIDLRLHLISRESDPMGEIPEGSCLSRVGPRLVSISIAPRNQGRIVIAIGHVIIDRLSMEITQRIILHRAGTHSEGLIMGLNTHRLGMTVTPMTQKDCVVMHLKDSVDHHLLEGRHLRRIQIHSNAARIMILKQHQRTTDNSSKLITRLTKSKRKGSYPNVVLSLLRINPKKRKDYLANRNLPLIPNLINPKLTKRKAPSLAKRVLTVKTRHLKKLPR
jgi:hypothetical protein